MRTHLIGLVVVSFIVSHQRIASAGETPNAPLSFEQTIELAKKRNPNLAIARTDIERAEGLIRQVRAGSLPTLFGNFVYTRLDGDRLVSDRVSQAQDTIQMNLTLSVPVIAASKWGAWRRADDTAELIRSQERVTERDVALVAARGYLTLLFQKRSLAVAEEALKTAKAHLVYSEQRYGGGVGTKIDVVRAAQEVEVSEVDLVRARTGITRASEALGIAIGLDRAIDIDGEPRLEGKEGVDVTNRADLIAIQNAAISAKRATNDGWREYMPGVNVVFQPFYQNPSTLTIPQTGYQAQLLVSLPFYDGGYRYGLEKERTALLEQARTRYDASLRQAKSDVRVAMVAVDLAKEAFERAKRSAALAHEAAELAKTGYSAGATTNLDLIDADRRARDADVQAALAEDTLRQARLELLASKGQFP